MLKFAKSKQQYTYMNNDNSKYMQNNPWGLQFLKMWLHIMITAQWLNLQYNDNELSKQIRSFKFQIVIYFINIFYIIIE